MERSQQSDNPNFSLRLIPFVTPTNELTSTNSPFNCSFDCGLTGEDASKFYKDIVSGPSKHAVPVQKTVPKLKKTSTTTDETHHRVTSDCVFRLAQEGNVKGLQQYVAKGYLIDQQDAYGWTPLMCATCEGHNICVEYLLQHGASISIKSKDGMTAVDIAKKVNNPIILQLLQNGLPSVKPSASHSSNHKIDETQKYCKSCKLYYKSSKLIHERGIAHLLSKEKSSLSTVYHIPENNKGFQIMLRSGWDKNKGLGPNSDGRKFPIKTVLKKDRSCIGKNKEVPKVTHFTAHDDTSVKRNKPAPIRTVREKTLKKWKREKINRINHRKEINFRRQFH